MAQTLFGNLAAIQFTPAEEALARHRGTTVADLRNVVLTKARDLQVAVDNLRAVTQDQETVDALQQLSQSIV